MRLSFGTKIWFLIGLALIAGLMGHYAFVIARHLSYPWWYELASDGDGLYVTQTLVLINNGDLTMVFHPGATVFAIHGFVYRILSFFVPAYHPFVHLDQVSTPAEAFAILDLAMRTSRVLTYALNIAGMAVFWQLLYQLTKNRAVAYFLAAFLMTTRFMLIERVTTIRPELISFIFCVLMLSFVLYRRESAGTPVAATGIWGGIMTGFLGGLAGLTKLQALPLVLCAGAWWVFMPARACGGMSSKKTAFFALAAAAGNFLIMPWAWLERPALLTDGYFKHFYPGSDQIRIYGTVPPDVCGPFVFVLAVLLIMTLIAGIQYKDQLEFTHKMVKLNLLVTGMIVSAYAVFLPLGMNAAAYAAASNHLLYASATNILFGGSLKNAVLDWSTWQRVANFQADILPYVRVAAAASLIRVCMRSTDRKPYYMVLLFFAAGFLMDVLSSFRRYTPDGPMISSYAIYSLPCHLCGLGAWLATECRCFRKRFGFDPAIIVCIVMAFNLWRVSADILARPRASGLADDQTPRQEMLNTTSAVWPFWNIVSHGNL